MANLHRGRELAIGVGALAVLALGVFGISRLLASPDKIKRWDDEGSASDRRRADDRRISELDPIASKRVEDAPPRVRIVADARCKSCRVDELEAELAAQIRGADITVVDYADPGGSALWSQVRSFHLPAVLLDEAAALAVKGTRLMIGAQQVGAGLALFASGAWNPECADAGGCAKPECADALVCKPETKATLALYTMAHCPHGATALTELETVLDVFAGAGAKLTVRVHYIGEDRGGVLVSRHGDDEVESDEVDVCVMRDYPTTSLDFLTCRAADYRGWWQNCAVHASGFDPRKIRACTASPDATSLLKASFAASSLAGIKKAPTWVVNGRYAFEALEADTIKDAVCAYNPAMGGCSVKVRRGLRRAWPKPMPGDPPRLLGASKLPSCE